MLRCTCDEWSAFGGDTNPFKYCPFCGSELVETAAPEYNQSELTVKVVVYDISWEGGIRTLPRNMEIELPISQATSQVTVFNKLVEEAGAKPTHFQCKIMEEL